MLHHGTVPEHNGGEMMDIFPDPTQSRTSGRTAKLLHSTNDATVKIANSSFGSAQLLGESNSHLAILYLSSRNLPCTRAHNDGRVSTSRDIDFHCSCGLRIHRRTSPALRCSRMGKRLFLTSLWRKVTFTYETVISQFRKKHALGDRKRWSRFEDFSHASREGKLLHSG